MKRTIAILLCVGSMSLNCGGKKHNSGPPDPPNLTPMKIDLRDYRCDVGDWCPTRAEVLWVLESMSACFLREYGALANMRKPCIEPVEWRKVHIKNESSSSWDSSGSTIDIYAGRNASYMQGLTPQQAKRKIMSALAHAEGHNSTCSSAGNSDHCKRDAAGNPSCGTMNCEHWCLCARELGLG